MGLFKKNSDVNEVEVRCYNNFMENEIIELVYQRYAVCTQGELLNKAGFINDLWNNVGLVKSICSEDTSLYQRYLEIRLENECNQPKERHLKNIDNELLKVLRKAYYYEENDAGHDLSISKQPHVALLKKLLGYYHIVGVTDTLLHHIDNLYYGNLIINMNENEVEGTQATVTAAVGTEQGADNQEEEQFEQSYEEIEENIQEKSIHLGETLEVEQVESDMFDDYDDEEEKLYLKLNAHGEVTYYYLMDLTADENYLLLCNMHASNNDGSIQDPVKYLDNCGACLEQVDETTLTKYHFEYTLEMNILERYV